MSLSAVKTKRYDVEGDEAAAAKGKEVHPETVNTLNESNGATDRMESVLSVRV